MVLAGRAAGQLTAMLVGRYRQTMRRVVPVILRPRRARERVVSSPPACRACLRPRAALKRLNKRRMRATEDISNVGSRVGAALGAS